MVDPVTKIDTRFSDPNASAISWDETRHILETAELFWIATVRTDGRPHMTPLVAVWFNDALYFSVGTNEQKTLNLRGNAHVILSTGCNQWDKGQDVVVEGSAVQITEDAKLRQLASAWTAKWDGRWHYQVRDGSFAHEDGEKVLVFEVKPAKVLVFGKGTFSHTRHQF